MMPVLQKELYDRLRGELRANHDGVAAAVRTLDAERIVRRPSPDSWSVAEVLEHITLMEELFLAASEPLVRDATPDAGAPNRPYSESFIGKKIADALEKPKPLKSPKAADPLTPRPGVAEAFLATDARLLAMIDAARTLDWNALRLRPPPAPWLPLRINLGDVFHIQAVHVRRHLAQIKRAKAALSI
jgi:hypothetical protein